MSTWQTGVLPAAAKSNKMMEEAMKRVTRRLAALNGGERAMILRSLKLKRPVRGANGGRGSVGAKERSRSPAPIGRVPMRGSGPRLHSIYPPAQAHNTTERS